MQGDEQPPALCRQIRGCVLDHLVQPIRQHRTEGRGHRGRYEIRGGHAHQGPLAAAALTQLPMEQLTQRATSPGRNKVR
jgi:hypothetical protein